MYVKCLFVKRSYCLCHVLCSLSVFLDFESVAPCAAGEIESLGLHWSQAQAHAVVQSFLRWLDRVITVTTFCLCSFALMDLRGEGVLLCIQ